MKQCPNCRNQIPDEAAFCPVCGTAVNAFHSFPEPYPPQPAGPTPPVYTQPVYVPPVPKVNPYDHTARFLPQDVAAHKLSCMLCYLLDAVGIIIALMIDKESDFTQFHVRQAMKFTVLEAVLAFAAGILCWTMVVPVLAAVALIVLLILKFICFVHVCRGKAVEPVLIRKIKFLK